MLPYKINNGIGENGDIIIFIGSNKACHKWCLSEAWKSIENAIPGQLTDEPFLLTSIACFDLKILS